MSRYGRAPTFYLGINVKDPPNEDNCPIVALYPLPESGGQEIHPWTHAVGVEWCVCNEGTRVISGVTECLGLVDADELGQMILDIINADAEYVSNQVDYNISPVEKWPLFQGEMSIVARPAPSGGAFFIGIESAQLYPVTDETMHAIVYGPAVELHQVDRFDWDVTTLDGLSSGDTGTIEARAEIDELRWQMTLGVFDMGIMPYLFGGNTVNAGCQNPAFKLVINGTVPGGGTATVTLDKCKVLGTSGNHARGAYAPLTLTGIGIGRLSDRRLMSFSGI